jgi:hypothetical protein
MISLLISLLFVVTNAAAESSEICKSWQNRFQVILKRAQEITTTDWSRENFNDIRVILFGENHQHKLSKFYADTLIALRHSDPLWDCVFLEEDRRISLEDTNPHIRTLHDLAAQSGFKPFFVDLTGEYPTWLKEYLKNRDVLYRTNPTEFKIQTDRVVKWIESEAYLRNVHMAQKISELIKEGTCHRGVGIFGGFHLDAEPNGDSAKTLPKYLSALGLTSSIFQILEPLTWVAGTNLGDPPKTSENVRKAKFLAGACSSDDEAIFLQKRQMVRLRDISYILVPNEGSQN